jgi:C1A family cysteine protease
MLPVVGGRRYGYLRDVPDHRDFGMRKFAHPALSSASIPFAVDLETYCGPVKDQGDLGACTAFAGCGMLEFLFQKYKNRSVVLSPRFLYYQELVLDGTLQEGDVGSCGRTSCKAINQFGVCEERDDPYSTKDFAVPPTPVEEGRAMFYRSGAYHRLSTVDDMRNCLASGYVFVVGFTVYESFEGKWEKAGALMPIPSSGERVLGGHEVLFIGYDDTKQAFKVRNSWGTGWGNGGNFWFPYVAAADSNILIDAWIQHLGKPW